MKSRLTSRETGSAGRAVCRVMAGLLVGGICLAADEAVELIQNFTVPDYDAAGNLKSELVGDRAEMLEGDLVRVSNLKIRFYSHGQVTMTVSAPECIYDRKKKQARSDGPVRIALENMVVTGTGFLWEQDEERLEIYQSAKVVLKGVSGKAFAEVEP